PNADGATGRSYFFLEADRGTMPVIRSNFSQTSFFRKLLAYGATWSQEIHRNRFGFHRFRVLTVTKSQPRVERMVEACAQLKQGRGLSLCADASILDAQAAPLPRPGRTARPGQTAALLG